MCRDCGQFNVHVSSPVVRVQLHDGSEHIFPKQTISRINGRIQRTKSSIEAAYSASTKVRLRDVKGVFITLDGKDIARMTNDILNRVYYDGELLQEAPSW